MKKTAFLLLLVLFWAMPQAGQAQTDPAADATLSAILAENITTVANLERMRQLQKEVSEAMKNVAWLRGLKSVRDLTILIENTACTYQDLSVLLQQRNYRNTSCMTLFEYKSSMIMITTAAEQIGYLVTEGTSMSSADRLSLLTGIMGLFVEANHNLGRLSSQYKAEIRAEKILVNESKKKADYHFFHF